MSALNLLSPSVNISTRLWTVRRVPPNWYPREICCWLSGDSLLPVSVSSLCVVLLDMRCKMRRLRFEIMRVWRYCCPKNR